MVQQVAPVAIRPRHRRSKDEQRELYAQVVEASLRFFAEGGYEAISMRRLASEVGVAPMSLYRYFPTKAHLVRHLWDAILSEASDRAGVRLAEERAPLKRLGAYLDEHIQYWLDNRQHYLVVFCLRDDCRELHSEDGAYVMRPDLHDFGATLAQLVDECIGRGSIQEVERKYLKEMLICKFLGFLAGVIGLSSMSWPDVPGLKERIVEDMIRQVSEACTAARLRSQPSSGRQHLTA